MMAISKLEDSGTGEYRFATVATVHPMASDNTRTRNRNYEVPRLHERQLQPNRLGRKRDNSRDADILDAALEVLAEAGYNGMTMDMVATRAKAGKATVYRRWRSKAELVIDAIGRMKTRQVDIEHLPDTGTLRGDLLGLFRPQPVKEAERKIRIMAGLASLLSQQQSLSMAAHSVMVEPWANAHRVLMQRARDRGEIPRTADIDAACQVVASMAAYRALVQRKPFEKDFLVSLIDGVVLPALGVVTVSKLKKSRGS